MVKPIAVPAEIKDDYKHMLKVIGNNIAKYRTLKHLSQGQLGRDIQVMPCTITLTEQGKTAINLSSLFKISKRLDVPVAAFLVDQGDFYLSHKQAEMLIAFQDFLAKGFQESDATVETATKVGRPRLNPEVFEDLPKL